MRGSITFKIVPSYRSQSMSCEVGNQKQTLADIFTNSMGIKTRNYFVFSVAERVTRFVPTVACKRPCQCHQLHPGRFQLLPLTAHTETFYVLVKQILTQKPLSSQLGLAIDDPAQRPCGEISSRPFAWQTNTHKSKSACMFWCVVCVLKNTHAFFHSHDIHYI